MVTESLHRQQWQEFANSHSSPGLRRCDCRGRAAHNRSAACCRNLGHRLIFTAPRLRIKEIRAGRFLSPPFPAVTNCVKCVNCVELLYPTLLMPPHHHSTPPGPPTPQCTWNADLDTPRLTVALFYVFIFVADEHKYWLGGVVYACLCVCVCVMYPFSHTHSRHRLFVMTC